MSGKLAMSLRAVSVRRGDNWVLRDISWRLRPGERWALLGDNGSGKTQLLKLLSGDVWPTPVGADTPQNGGRTYSVGRREVDLIDAKRRVAYVGAEQQDKHARYGWNLRVRDLVATGLHRTDLLLLPVTAAQAKRVAAALRICGISRHAAREFLTLSYGQKRLALLARALVQDPDWLLLDEFYNGLDEAYRRRIDRVLRAASRRGQSWVATAHRAVDVPRGTRCVLELAAGRVHAARPLRASDRKRLAKHAGETPRGRARVRKQAAAGAPVLIQMSHVDLYVDYRLVLRDLQWQLRRGEHWAVHGSNGSGKSSFLKMLYGDLPPALGRAYRAGRISQGLIDRRMEETYRLRFAGTAKRLCRQRQCRGTGDERPIREYRSSGSAHRGRSQSRGTLAEILRPVLIRRVSAARVVVWATAARAHRTRDGGRCADLAAG